MLSQRCDVAESRGQPSLASARASGEARTPLARCRPTRPKPSPLRLANTDTVSPKASSCEAQSDPRRLLLVALGERVWRQPAKCAISNRSPRAQSRASRWTLLVARESGCVPACVLATLGARLLLTRPAVDALGLHARSGSSSKKRIPPSMRHVDALRSAGASPSDLPKQRPVATRNKHAPPPAAAAMGHVAGVPPRVTG